MSVLSEGDEELIYASQDEWLEEHFHDVLCNQGWFVDEVEGEIGTKIYGHGVVVSSLDGMGGVNHTFTPL